MQGKSHENNSFCYAFFGGNISQILYEKKDDI